MPGLVQLQDKIVARCALTIYPYLLWGGWTCGNCGQEIDKWGQAVEQEK